MTVITTLRTTLLPALLATLAVLLVPAGADASRVSVALDTLRDEGKIDKTLARSSKVTYNAARRLRKQVKGAKRTAMANQIRTIEQLVIKRRMVGDRVLPLFSQLQVNIDWFKTKGPAPSGTRSRFGDSRIYYQYFHGWGWQFHPLANFSRLNAVWTSKTAAARRSLGKYAHELISFGVLRGGALTWEYYSPFSGSAAPYISAISQGTAIQALSRSGNALDDPQITAASVSAAKAFSKRAPVGLHVPMNGGAYFAAYSGNRKLVIFNIFVQGLNGLRTHAKITDDADAWKVYEEGLVTARAILPRSDTRAWSLYSLRGHESNLNYHQVLTGFVEDLCKNTSEKLFCMIHKRFDAYLKRQPKISGISSRVANGRLRVGFRLSKISTVTVRAGNRSVTATVARGKRVFTLNRRTKTRVTITARDLAGNVRQVRK